jgi:hypothetical protein
MTHTYSFQEIPMTVVINTVFRGTMTLVGVLSFILCVLFVFLAYTNPTQLDTMVHQAHEVIPAAIDSVTRHIENFKNKIL